MIEGVDFAVGLVMAVLVPVVIMLIESLRNEKRISSLEEENKSLRADVSLYMGIAVTESPHEFLEADLPNEGGE